MRGLVLGGGSIKGAFQAGVVSKLLHSGYKPQGLFGISTGALNSAFMADRAGRQLSQSGTIDWPSIGDELEHFWLDHVTKPADLVQNKSFIGDTLFGHFDGLLDSAGLQAIVKNEIRQENLIRYYAEGERYFSIGAVDLWSGQIIYADLATAEYLIDFVIASAAIPFALPFSWIQYPLAEKSPYVDGGVRDLAPLQRAISKHCDEITAVVCQPATFIGDMYNVGNIIKTVERVIDILLAEALDNDLRVVNGLRELALELPREATKNSSRLAPYLNLPKPMIYRPDSLAPWLALDITAFTSADINAMVVAGKNSQPAP